MNTADLHRNQLCSVLELNPRVGWSKSVSEGFTNTAGEKSGEYRLNRADDVSKPNGMSHKSRSVLGPHNASPLQLSKL
jgi:hypothetical protein